MIPVPSVDVAVAAAGAGAGARHQRSRRPGPRHDGVPEKGHCPEAARVHGCGAARPGAGVLLVVFLLRLLLVGVKHWCRFRLGLRRRRLHGRPRGRLAVAGRHLGLLRAQLDRVRRQRKVHHTAHVLKASVGVDVDDHDLHRPSTQYSVQKKIAQKIVRKKISGLAVCWLSPRPPSFPPFSRFLPPPSFPLPLFPAYVPLGRGPQSRS